MFHSNTELVIERWRELARHGRTPGRKALHPSAFPKLLPQVLILGRTGPGDYRIRLAGALVAEVHRQSDTGLAGRDGLADFAQHDRAALRTALETSRRNCEPLVLRTDALWGPTGAELEMVFAPLAGDDGGPDRFLGLYQPLGRLPSTRNPLTPQFVLRHFEHAARPAGVMPRLRLAALDGRIVA